MCGSASRRERTSEPPPSPRALRALGGNPLSRRGLNTGRATTFVCGVPVTLTLLNDASAAFTSSTSVGVAVGVVVTDVGTGQVLFSHLTHGFEVNGLKTVSCI